MLNLKAILGRKGERRCREFYAWGSSSHACANDRPWYSSVAIACQRRVPEECCLWLYLFGRLCWERTVLFSQDKMWPHSKIICYPRGGATSAFHDFNGVHQRCVNRGHAEIGLEVLYWSNCHLIMPRWKGKHESELMKWHSSASPT